jgi:hypothetical protein
MKSIVRLIIATYLAAVLAACGGNPGPLEGTWQMTGIVPMTVTFRKGETEAMGMIEKVSYKTEGNDVLVTYLDGLAKGTTMRYTITGQNSARTELGTLKRIR